MDFYAVPNDDLQNAEVVGDPLQHRDHLYFLILIL